MLKSYRSCRFCRIWKNGLLGEANVTYQIPQTRQSSNVPKIVVDLLDGWSNPVKLHTKYKQNNSWMTGSAYRTFQPIYVQLKRLVVEAPRFLIENVGRKKIAKLLGWEPSGILYVWLCFYLVMVLQSCVLLFISHFCVVAAFGDFPGDKLFIWSTHGIQMRADGLCSLLVWLIGVPVPSV